MLAVVMLSFISLDGGQQPPAGDPVTNADEPPPNVTPSWIAGGQKFVITWEPQETEWRYVLHYRTNMTAPWQVYGEILHPRFATTIIATNPEAYFKMEVIRK